IYKLIQKNNLPNTGIRLGLTGGKSEDGFSISKPNLLISQHHFKPPSKEQLQNGIHLMSFHHQRQFPQVKTIDYLMAIWLKPLLNRHGADEALYCQNGVISECPRSNFFLITKEKKIITPASNILKGITRMKVLELAQQHFEVEEKDLKLEDIKDATAAFITSTTKGILPVSKIDGHTFLLKPVHYLKEFFERQSIR
ncbi:MAG: aminotransferase class IV, partial [Bacteroidota bacterium]|nr:aminotransferase class IV [Bacteroidota bacterium]